MTEHIAGVSRLIAVASGKGGVGKTTVTVNLALALAATGRRVGLFDADIYGPNIPLLLNIQPTQTLHTELPIARAHRGSYIRPVERFGLKVMSIGLLLGTSDTVMLESRFVALLVTQTLRDVMWGELDCLLLDLPPGTGEPQQSLLQTFHLDGVVLVTTPQDLSLLDTSRSLGLFHQANVPILGVVENMSYFTCPHCGEPIDLWHESEHRWAVQEPDLPILGRIPLARTLSRGIDQDHPLLKTRSPDAEARVFHNIATEIQAHLGDDERMPES